MVAGDMPAVWSEQGLGLPRPPRAWLVDLDRRRFANHRIGDLPEALNSSGSCEKSPVTDHDVVDHPLVGVERPLGTAEAIGVAEAHVSLAELHLRPRHLGQEAGGDRAGVAELEAEVVVAGLLGDLS